LFISVRCWTLRPPIVSRILTLRPTHIRIENHSSKDRERRPTQRTSNMALPVSLILLIADLAIAAPLPLHDSHPLLLKRGPSGHTVGVGFAITISIIVFAAVVFYLGVRRGQTGTWYCWRDPPESSHGSTDDEKIEPSRRQDIKSTIGFPALQRATVPIELSPVEAKPTFLELPTEKLYELGEKSPRRFSWYDDMKKKSWFGGKERKGSTATTRTKRSLYEMEGSPISPVDPPAYPDPVAMREWEKMREGQGEKEGEMDWSGIEFMRKMYKDRVSVYKPGG
jgi:hypothetical protein